jgi:hypothetical protein
MKTMYFINAAVLAVTLSAAMQASAALKTCEDEIKETNTFLSEQGVAPINDVTDLATTLRNIKNFGRLPDRYITYRRSKASWLVWQRDGNSVGVKNQQKMDWRR